MEFEYLHSKWLLKLKRSMWFTWFQIICPAKIDSPQTTLHHCRLCSFLVDDDHPLLVAVSSAGVHVPGWPYSWEQDIEMICTDERVSGEEPKFFCTHYNRRSPWFCTELRALTAPSFLCNSQMDISVNDKLQHAVKESCAIECYVGVPFAELLSVQFVDLPPQSV